MVFNSVSFAIFFPIAVLIYFILPGESGKYRKIWLLLCSYYFYICQGASYALLLFAATLITYLTALFMKRRKALLIPGLLFCFALLFFFKYFDFFCESFNISAGFNILLPVGISFYLFKSASYLIDVYRGDCAPEKNFIKYALYVSFFPELLAGPISRAPEVMPQFDEEHSFDYGRIRKGLLRMLYGYFVKLVIASRLAILVDRAYGNVSETGGLTLLIASLVYSVQIYCDFMSYSEIALGAGEVMGITLHENFRQPFFAKDLSELWRRWHISLMDWFRDYLYIPLGGSRKGTVRKYLNILIVFTVSGLWHGAAWTYILWGFLSGLLQCIGIMTRDIRSRIVSLFPVHNGFTGALHSLYMRVATFCLFTFTVIFFRAGSIEEAFLVISKIAGIPSGNGLSDFSPSALGLGTLNLLIALFMVFVLLVTDIIREKKGDIFELVTGSKWYIRWGVYYFLTVSILLSANIGAAKFIYYAF